MYKDKNKYHKMLNDLEEGYSYHSTDNYEELDKDISDLHKFVDEVYTIISTDRMDDKVED